MKWLDPGAFGTLGVGAGFALGAKIVCPDRPVWIIFGDGAFGYSLSEFDTFVRHQVRESFTFFEKRDRETLRNRPEI